MVNILPDRAKKKLLIEYYIRVFTVYLYLFASVFFTLTILFIPSMVFINGYFDNFNKDNKILTEENIVGFDNVVKTLEKSLKESEAVLREDKVKNVSGYLKLFFKLADNDDIKIKSLNLKRSDDGSVEQVIIAGLAGDRRRLTNFRDLLMQQDKVAGVDFPISSLAKSQNINFTLTVNFESFEHVKK